MIEILKELLDRIPSLMSYYMKIYNQLVIIYLLIICKKNIESLILIDKSQCYYRNYLRK